MNLKTDIGYGRSAIFFASANGQLIREYSRLHVIADNKYVYLQINEQAMYGEARKPHLIEEILKIESDTVLNEVETVISRAIQVTPTRKSFKDFAGTMSNDEANELEKIIADGCEQIHPDDWK